MEYELKKAGCLRFCKTAVIILLITAIPILNVYSGSVSDSINRSGQRYNPGYEWLVVTYKTGVSGIDISGMSDGDILLIRDFIDKQIENACSLLLKRYLSEEETDLLIDEAFNEYRREIDLEILHSALAESTEFLAGNSQNGEKGAGVNENLQGIVTGQEIIIPPTASIPITWESTIPDKDNWKIRDVLMTDIDHKEITASLEEDQGQMSLIPLLVVYGDVYVLEMHLYNAVTDSWEDIGRISFTRQSSDTLFPYIRNYIATHIGGYMPSEIQVEINNDMDEGEIILCIDDVTHSIDDEELKIVPSGYHDIQVLYGNTVLYDEMLQTHAGESLVIDLTGRSVPAKYSLVVASDYGTGIVSDNMIFLETPVLTEFPGYRDNYVIHLPRTDYFGEEYVAIKADQLETGGLPRIQTVSTAPVWEDFDDYVKEGQEEFYQSFTDFILTIPVSVLLYDLSVNTDYPLADSAFSVSLVLSGTMLLDTILNLVNYYGRLR